jgi:predicted transposase YbfD/YdcC
MERAKRHRLLDILVIAWCTLWTGGEGFQEMELVGKSKLPWLQPFLAFPPGLPSHAPFGRVFARLQPQRCRECFLAWPQAGAHLPQEALVSLDGKTVQAALDRATASSPWPMLSAWCAEHGGLVLGQIQTEPQSHAITAMPALLPWRALPGGIVTIDAMGGQTASAEARLEQGGAYLLTSQGNHQKAYTTVKEPLHQHIEPHLPWHKAPHCFAAFDDAHGRTGRRSVWSMPDLAPLPALATWPGLPSLIAVETMRMAHPQAPVTSDYRFDLASLG